MELWAISWCKLLTPSGKFLLRHNLSEGGQSSPNNLKKAHFWALVICSDGGQSWFLLLTCWPRLHCGVSKFIPQNFPPGLYPVCMDLELTWLQIREVVRVGNSRVKALCPSQSYNYFLYWKWHYRSLGEDKKGRAPLASWRPFKRPCCRPMHQMHMSTSKVGSHMKDSSLPSQYGQYVGSRKRYPFEICLFCVGLQGTRLREAKRWGRALIQIFPPLFSYFAAR